MSAKPTPLQAAWQDLEIGMFIHFAPNTWQDSQWDKRTTPFSEINPSKLDTEQWVDAAEALGARYIIFVAKHIGGFCMWPTKTTDYCIKNTPWRNGKGDVLKDLSESCRKRGMGLGVYLSPRDDTHGAGIGGRCDTPEQQARYNEMYREQLKEVLTGYGDMMEVWFDGSLVMTVGDVLQKYAPRAMVFNSPHATLRWVGNEEGFAPYPAWNALSRKDADSGVSTALSGRPDGEVWLPLECDARIRAHWFWTTQNASTLKSVDQLMEMYYRSVGHGATLLLNHTPDITGLIPEADFKRGKEFGDEVRRRFGNSMAEISGKGKALELRFPNPVVLDHLMLMEDIVEGERVRQYVVEAATGGEWLEMCRGIAIGHKKIDGFARIETNKLRWRCLDSVGEPTVRCFAAFFTGANPSARAGKTTVPIFVGVAAWKPESLNKDGSWVEVDMDITPQCRKAGEYEFIIRRTSGKHEIVVKDVVLLHNGKELPEHVEGLSTPYDYRLIITDVDAEIRLKAKISAKNGTDSEGVFMIREIEK
jgi:alpha-L-fucosidase